MTKKNPYRVMAQVPVQADLYADLLSGGDRSDLDRLVLTTMNGTAAERERRVFGQPTQTDAVEVDGVVWLSFVADTEPEPR